MTKILEYFSQNEMIGEGDTCAKDRYGGRDPRKVEGTNIRAYGKYAWAWHMGLGLLGYHMHMCIKPG